MRVGHYRHRDVLRQTERRAQFRAWVLVFLAALVALPTLAQSTHDSDLWFAEGEDGWGIHITQSGPNLFATWYTYDANARQTFFTVAGGSFTAPGVWQGGAIYKPTGTSIAASRYDATQFRAREPIGSAELRFTSRDRAVFNYTVGGVSRSKNIARFAFAGATSGLYPVDYTDVYFNASENGWGVSVVQRGATGFFGVLYHYDTDGEPLFYTLVATRFSVGGGAVGDLYRTRSQGSHFLSTSFMPRDIVAERVGTFALIPADNALTLDYRIGNTRAEKSVTRLISRPVNAIAASCLPESQAIDRVTRWQQDLRCVADTVAARHPDPTERGDYPQFRAALAQLGSEVAGLTDAQIATRLAAATANLRDGHTNFFPAPQNLPVRFELFADGLYAVTVPSGHAALLGRRLERMGELSAAELRRRIATLIPAENAFTVSAREAALASNREVLLGVGASEEATGITVTAVDANGRSDAFRISYSDSSPPVSVPNPLPPTLRQRNSNYWYEIDPVRRTLLFQYNVCRERPDLPMQSIANTLQPLLQSGAIDKIVVDLRFNSGGDSSVINPLGPVLLAWNGIQDPNRTKILVGTQTYSAALMNAFDFKTFTGARSFGETPGGNIDVMFGEVRSVTLPYSQRVLSFSTKRFALSSQARVLTPDQSVTWDWASYRAGVDPVLEAALR